MCDQPSRTELLWRQYALHADLYKYYMSTVFKIVGFYYVTTGALLSFYLTQDNQELVKWAIMLPTLGSLFLAFIFIYASSLLKVTRQEMFDIRDKLDLDTAPEFQVLKILLIASSILLFATALALGILIYFAPTA